MARTITITSSGVIKRPLEEVRQQFADMAYHAAAGVGHQLGRPLHQRGFGGGGSSGGSGGWSGPGGGGWGGWPGRSGPGSVLMRISYVKPPPQPDVRRWPNGLARDGGRPRLKSDA